MVRPEKTSELGLKGYSEVWDELRAPKLTPPELSNATLRNENVRDNMIVIPFDSV